MISGGYSKDNNKHQDISFDSEDPEESSTVSGSLWKKTRNYAVDWWHMLSNSPSQKSNKYLLSMPPSDTDSKFTSFCKAVSNIEELREHTVVQLQVISMVFSIPDVSQFEQGRCVAEQTWNVQVAGSSYKPSIFSDSLQTSTTGGCRFPASSSYGYSTTSSRRERIRCHDSEDKIKFSVSAECPPGAQGPSSAV
jgi:hypothetical protein